MLKSFAPDDFTNFTGDEVSLLGDPEYKAARAAGDTEAMSVIATNFWKKRQAKPKA